MKTIQQIGSWIHYHEPVTIKQLVEYSGTADRKAKALLVFLTCRIPLYEDDKSRLYIDPEMPGFKNFRLLEPKEL